MFGIDRRGPAVARRVRCRSRCGPGGRVPFESVVAVGVGRAGGDAGRELPAVQQQAVHVPVSRQPATKPDKASVTGCN